MHDAHTPAHDSDTTRIDALKEALGAFSDDTLSLYFPKPIVQVGGEKWRILRKNLVDALEGRNAPKAIAFIEALELEDFRGDGVAVFEDLSETGHNFRTSHLTVGPVAMMTRGKPFALPLLRDVQSRETKWVLALDKEEPKLYLYSGGSLIDHSARLQTTTPGEEVTFETVSGRREVQDDIFFHSGSRGRAPAAMARSAYGALGTSAEQEREKTDDAYYELVIDALQYGLPYQVSELVVMGAEKTIGRFCQMIEQDLGKDFQLHQVQGGGEALEEWRITETLQTMIGETPEMPELETVSDEQTIIDACKMGRVGQLYVSEELTGMSTVSSEDSEHVRIRIIGKGLGEELGDALPANDVVMAALAQGAEVEFVPAEVAKTPFTALMRWDLGTDGNMDGEPQSADALQAAE